MGLVLSTFFENDETQKMDREFMNRAAHDIRSPLTTLNFTMHALKKQGVGNEAVELMNQAVSRINSIANDILQNRKEVLSKSQGVDLAALVSYFSREFAGQNSSRKIQIAVRSSLKCSMAVGDLWQLKRIIYNLVQNSEEAGAETVLVDFVERAGMVQIFIKDNGSGIPESLLKCVGEEGFTTKHNGNGIGLSSAMQMVESWGGAVKVQSDREGTLVLLNLPAIQ